MCKFVKQIVYCYRCEKTMEVIKREKRTSVKSRLCSQKLCKHCLRTFRTKRAQEFREMNKTQKMKNLVSARMKKSNPMFCETNRIKVSNTLKRKYKSGELVSPFADPKIKKIAEKRSTCTLRRKYKSGELVSPFADPKIRKLASLARQAALTTEYRQLMSKRMLGDNNPMKNPETVRKVQQTLKERCDSGILKRKTGRQHGNWKGTSSFNKTVRSRLYPVFTKPVMERDNYTCQLCSKEGGILHAHHVVSLRSIIDELLTALGINDVSKLIDTNHYDELVNIVVKNHHVDNGQTVCPKCHGKIDDRYRRKEHKKTNVSRTCK